jgi:hypothetical protein
MQMNLKRLVGFFFRTFILFSLPLFIQSFAHARETIGFGYEEDLTSPRLIFDVRDEFTGARISDSEIQISGDAVKIVSVKREGYAEVMIAGLKTGKLTVFLKPTGSLGSQAIVSGDLQNYLPLLPGNVDGGLILRTLGVTDLLSLNPDTLMSPLKDTIQLVGPREIPSNLVFPDQRIGLVIRLNKPTYRLPMSSYRKGRIVAIHAAIPTTSLLSLPSSPKAADLANVLSARKIGWTEELSPTESVTKPIAFSTNVDRKISLVVPKPPFPADLYGLNFLDLQSDRQSLLTSDVKALKQGTYEAAGVNTISLGVVTSLPNGASQKVVAAALANDGDQISVNILAHEAQVTAPEFMPVEVLARAFPKVMKVKAPAKGMIIVSLQEKTSADGNFGKQIFVLPGAGEVSVPLQDLSATMKASRYSVSRLEFDDGYQPNHFEGGEVAKNLKRFTFSGSDLD